MKCKYAIYHRRETIIIGPFKTHQEALNYCGNNPESDDLTIHELWGPAQNWPRWRRKKA
jgi:hypothetical protein